MDRHARRRLEFLLEWLHLRTLISSQCRIWLFFRLARRAGGKTCGAAYPHEEAGIFLKRKPLVMKFTREMDCTWRPFELHLARCSKWGKGVDRGLRTGRTKEPIGQTSSAEQGWASQGYPDQGVYDC